MPRSTGVCRTDKVDLVQALGADHVVDYTEEDFAHGGHHFDAIIDTGCNRRLSQLRRSLTPRGTLVIVGGETGGRWLGGFDRLLRAPLLSALVSQKLRLLTTSENSEDWWPSANSSRQGRSRPQSTGRTR